MAWVNFKSFPTDNIDMETEEFKMAANTFSIRYKFLAVTSLLLFLCVSVYLYLAVNFFKKDKINLVFEYSRTSVERLSSEVDRFFNSLFERIDLVALGARQDIHLNSQDVLKQAPDLVWLAKVNPVQNSFKVVYKNTKFIKTYDLQKDYLSQQMKLNWTNVGERVKKHKSTIWSFSNQSQIPLIGLGRIVIFADSRGTKTDTYIALAKVNELERTIKKSDLTEFFLTNPKGELLAGQLSGWSKSEIQNHPLFEKAKESLVNTGVLSIAHKQKEYLGAFSRASKNNVFVFSQTNKDYAFYSVKRFLFRSFIFAGVIAVSVFIAAILFSQTLTRPLFDLLQGIRSVAKGDLDVKINVESRDEIKILADSFNHMIGDLKVSRQRILKAKEELEDKVKERTQQLEVQNQAVKKSQEALLQNTRLAAIGEVAGQAAHEVLNPLTNIMSRLEKVERITQEQQVEDLNLLHCITDGWTQDFQKKGIVGLVQDWQKPSEFYKGKVLFEEDLENLRVVHESFKKYFEDKNHDIQFLLKEAQRINKIVSSMRSLSTVKGEYKEYSIVQLVTESIHVMADMADQMGVKVILESKSDGDFILVDEYEFVQVLTNLIRNSLQSMAEKLEQQEFEPHLKIQIFTEDNKVNIQIQDNGLGISVENQAKLFNSQFTTKSPENGTGLGLNISRRFIRQFKGDLKLVSSQQGQGSTFVIEVPLASRFQQEVS